MASPLRPLLASIRPGVGFWVALLFIVATSYVVYYRFLWGGSASRLHWLGRALLSLLLPIATYLLVINVTFALATFIFGA